MLVTAFLYVAIQIFLLKERSPWVGKTSEYSSNSFLFKVAKKLKDVLTSRFLPWTCLVIEVSKEYLRSVLWINCRKQFYWVTCLQPTIDLFYRHLLMEQKVIQVNETPQLAESVLARSPNCCFWHVVKLAGEVVGGMFSYLGTDYVLHRFACNQAQGAVSLKKSSF